MVEKTTIHSGKTVNSQITDAITQTNALAVGMAPAQSMATLYQTMSHSTGTAMQNAVANQQNLYSLNLAALTQNLQAIMENGAAAAPRAMHGQNSNLRSRSDAELMQLLAELIDYHVAKKRHSENTGGAHQTATATPDSQ